MIDEPNQSELEQPAASANVSPEEEQQTVSQINARIKIIEILSKVDTRQSYSDKLLERSIEELNELDRGLVTEVVNGVLRWQYRIDWFLGQLYVGEYENLIPDVKNNLRASLYQLIYLNQIPAYAVLNEAVEIAKNKFNQKTANLVNAILRNYLRQQKKLEYLEMTLDSLEKFAVRYSHPQWLLQRWIEYWGIDEVGELCEVNNSRPRISVRLNSLLAQKDTFCQLLDENGIPHEVHPDFPNFVWIDDFSEFRKLEFLKKGWVTVQDVSAGIPILLLDPQPGETILDMCAAPGGKTGYIAENMQNQGRLIALERHFSRAKFLKDNLSRLNIENTCVLSGDSLQLPLKINVDKVLLDAPCTGFGVLSKRVDLKWKRSLSDIENMNRLQLQLLHSAAAAVKENGIIVYSTCTIEPEENEQVVQKFLQNNQEFQLEKLSNFVPRKYLWDKTSVRTFPHKHAIDGSYAVRIRKILR